MLDFLSQLFISLSWKTAVLFFGVIGLIAFVAWSAGGERGDVKYKRTLTGPERQERFRQTALPMFASIAIGIGLALAYVALTDSQPGWLVPVTVCLVVAIVVLIDYRAGTRDQSD